MKIGLSVGCLIAILLLVVAGVSKYNTLENKIDNLAKWEAPATTDNHIKPLEIKDGLGQSAVVAPANFKLSAKDAACLKLIDGLVNVEGDASRVIRAIEAQMGKLGCGSMGNSPLLPEVK